jgi:putative oxidoreductase
VRRLFSSFARGFPGLGLLIMRFVSAAALAGQSVASLHTHTSTESSLLVWVRFAISLAILLGLWTPIAGALGFLVEVWLSLNSPGDIWMPILIGTLAGALALIGPGAWSIDARLFGWKRIEIEHKRK